MRARLAWPQQRCNTVRGPQQQHAITSRPLCGCDRYWMDVLCCTCLWVVSPVHRRLHILFLRRIQNPAQHSTHHTTACRFQPPLSKLLDVSPRAQQTRRAAGTAFSPLTSHWDARWRSVPCSTAIRCAVARLRLPVGRQGDPAERENAGQLSRIILTSGRCGLGYPQYGLYVLRTVRR
jgi:hypothetical protein